MRGHTSSITTAILVLFGLTMPAATWADLPPDQNIACLMREAPEDPNSPVVFAVTLTLRASSSDGDSIGWSVIEVGFIELDEHGNANRTWVEDDPNVPTADGLWWIGHANPAAPQPSEFAQPPLLEGKAAGQDPLQADLNYSFKGVAYDPPLVGSLYDSTAALDYKFTLVGSTQPIQAGEDEPVEIDGDRDPPVSQ